ncbi:LAGLIDADG family homing endonuclease [Alicyclobacillus fodiniaquatilis]|uniref:LAGLIDADG family homing endonuclease n=1 Tax=Alicyclobacillus fodiniaquatilis TaxID=1661150 RepID=A0ABW4JK21_9BACL
MGCIQAKSLTLKFPNIPHNLQTAFIRGYFDGDGSLHVHKNGIKAEIHFVGTQEFLRGIESTLALPKITFYKKGKAYQSTYGGGKQTLRILETLYGNSTIHLDRKFQLYEKFKTEREKRYISRKKQIERVVNLHKEGLTVKEISKQTKHLPYLVLCWLEMYAGYCPKRNNAQIEQDNKKFQEVDSLLKAGVGLREIDRKVRLSSYRVKMYAIRNGYLDSDELV